MSEEIKSEKHVNQLSDDDLERVIGGAGAVAPKPVTQKGTAGTGTGLGAGKAEFDAFE